MAESTAWAPAERRLLGREEELSALSALLEDSARGVGAMAWLEGEAGIGKSTLIAAAAEVADERGFRVLAAGAEELDAHRAFGVVADCLGVERRSSDERRAALARTLSPTPPTAPDTLAESGGTEFALAEELLGLVEEACAGSPSMLVLDDLQWADPSSLVFLGRLARELGGLPLVVVGAARPLPRRAELERLLAATVERGAVRIALGPLDDAACVALAGELAGGKPGPLLSERAAACGGNPLFVAELVGALASEGAIEIGPGGRAEVTRVETPGSLWLTVLARLSFLSRDAVEILGLASVVGSSFSVANLSLVSGRPAAALWGPLREAMASGVLEERGDRLAFRHDVVREALYGDLPRAVRAALHLDLGRALGAGGAPAGQVAEHVLRGAQPGDREAVAWLERAAREAAPRGAQVAAELLEEALRLCDPSDPGRRRLVADLALNLAAAGRHDQAQELCRETLEDDPSPAVEGALRLCLAESLMDQGRLREALEQAQRVAQAPELSERDRARALSWLTAGVFFSRDQAATVAAATRAREAGERAGHAGVVATALDHLGHVAGFQGDFFEQQRLIGEAAAVARRDGTPEAHQSVPQVDHAMALADLDRFEESVGAVAAGRRTYARLGLEQATAMSSHYAGYGLFWAGEWDDALAEWETAGRLGEELGTGWQVDTLAARAVILARRGELEDARRVLDRGRAHRDAGALEWRIGWLAWAQALVHEGAGRSEDALAKLWWAWEAATQAGTVYEQRVFAPELARLLAAAGERERGVEVASAVEALSARNPGLASLEALALRCRAVAERDVDGLLHAASAYRATPRLHERALACEDAAVGLAEAGRLDEVELLADEALSLYAGLRAEREIARTEGRLRAVGVRRARRGSRARASSGWGSLTPSELRVAELAAQGLSNREIAERLVLSRHTVVTHVSNVLGKLKLRSRLELAAARAAHRQD